MSFTPIFNKVRISEERKYYSKNAHNSSSMTPTINRQCQGNDRMIK